MNPRLFCREQSYHKALLLTYSFDPIFFEQVVLPDLWAGRSSDIFVLGDHQQIAGAVQAAAGQVWHIGKRYLLAGANHTGSFHPKVLLRLGAKDGLIMMGSGNLTSSGWGGSQELGTAWMLGPDHADKGEWLHLFLDDVMSWCSSEIETDAVQRMKDVPWLSLTPVALDGASPVLHSKHGHPLGPTLAQRWAGRQFDELRILTGSTDESGAFLRWAHATFGIKRAIVALTPTMASFLPEKLADLPIDLRLIAAPADRPLHAKFYWFDGPSGSGAIMGSANCSAAAWLLPPDQRGNVETVVVYDTPSAAEFESALTIFSAPSQAPNELLVPRRLNTIDPPITERRFELVSLSWDSSVQYLRAVIRPTPSVDLAAELIFGGKNLAMTHSQTSDGYLECELPDGIGKATAFASVRLRQGDLNWTTTPRWIDDLAALQHASQAARLLEPFKELERNASSAEKRRMLDELQEVAQALFNDSASFRDPGFGSDRNGKKEDDTPAVPVNLNDLICHLEEPHESPQRFGSSRPGTLSLVGILRLLFNAEADESGDTVAAQDEQIDEGQLPGNRERIDAMEKPEQETAQQDTIPIEERFRERLAAQITTFLDEMSSATFAERCTATQMVQAVSFPLAVALRGQRQGWVSADLAERWALEVFSILFRGKGAGSGGLLNVVEQRYAQNQHISTFGDVVGDGTLWMVLVATLGNTRWQGVGTDIDKAVALREVFTAPQLLASAYPSRVADLLGKIRIEDARSYLADVAPKARDLLNQMENILSPIWEAGMRSQTIRPITHRLGDLLWRERVGWAVCLADAAANSEQPIKVRLRGVEKYVMAGFYVNVSDLAHSNSSLMESIKHLSSCVRNSGVSPISTV